MDPSVVVLVIAGIALGAVFSLFAVWVMRELPNQRRSFPQTLLDGIGVILSTVLVLLLILVTGVGVLTLIGAFVIADAWCKHRAAQQYSLLWLLTVSAERMMPLAPAVEAFARERGGSFGRMSRRLAEMLNGGVSLPDALETVPGLVPRSALPLIRVGSDSGSLAAALRQAATTREMNDPAWMALIGRFAYLMLVPVFGCGLMLFIAIKIVPAFVTIFADFKTRLPNATLALIAAMRGLVNYWYLFALLILLLVALLVYALGRYFEGIRWGLPGFDWITRRLDTARILDCLALAAGRERPLPEAVVSLARSYPNPSIRDRLRMAAGDMVGGRDWAESLESCGLIRRADRAVLQAAARAGNLAWALGEMADSNRRRLAYRLYAFAQAMVPPAILLVGLVVAFVVVALFMPLISLIQHLV